LRVIFGRAEAWLAGAGIESVTDVDQQELFNAIFPEGSGNGDMADLMDHANVLSMREVPLPIMMPDWNMWLPDHAPEDMWDAGLMLDDYNISHRRRYLDGSRIIDGPYLAFEKYKETLKNETVASLAANNQLAATITEFNKVVRNWFGQIRGIVRSGAGLNVVNARKPGLYRETVSSSITRWIMIRNVEMMRRYDMEREYDNIEERRKKFPRYTPEALNFPIDTTLANVFTIAPHIISENNTSFPWQEDQAGKFESNQWYLLSLILHAGHSAIIRDNVPVDWAYLINHLVAAQDRSGLDMSLIRLAFQAKMLQSTRTGMGIRQGGYEQRNNAPNFFYSVNRLERGIYRGGLNEYQDGLWEMAFEEIVHEWLYILQSYDIDDIPRDDDDRRKIETSTFVPEPWVGDRSKSYFLRPGQITATALYRLIPLIHKDGINEALIIDLQEWCKRAWPYNSSRWASTPSWDSLFEPKALFMENFEDGVSVATNIDETQFAIKDNNL